ncbi:DUF2975 domain-containing protein [Desulfocurvibacter africanus]|uniref:DUF2975 domain-containing protein n=1 Tax=Desulfocurvibacter africanus TaxID=873 RepID=UPI0003FA9FC2|nr:DUF2975 domain-containing protein [Desulfocurvibacter africanus]
MMIRSLGQFRKVCTILQVTAAVLALALPVGGGIFWIFVERIPPELLQDFLPVLPSMPIPLSTKMLGFMIMMMLPGAVNVYGLVVVSRLFRLYKQGSIFQPGVIHCYRKLGLAILLSVPADILCKPLLSVALTYANGPGHRTLIVGLSSNDIRGLLVGGAVLAIAWVMEQAQKLEEEQALTI